MLDKLGMTSVFIYTFFMVSTFSTAGSNLACALLIIVALWKIKKSKDYTVRIPGYVWKIGLILFVPLFVAAFIHGDAESIYLTIRYFYKALMIIPVYWALVYFRSKMAVLFGLIAGSWLHISMALYQGYTQGWTKRVTGAFDAANAMTMIFELTLPFLIVGIGELLREKKQTKLSLGIIGIGIITVLFIFLVMLLAASRGSFLALGITAILIVGSILCTSGVALAKKHTYRLIGLVLLGVLIVGSLPLMGKSYERHYDNERILLLESSYHMWDDHKLVGIGLANWQKEYKPRYMSPKAKEPNLSFPHNMIAHFFAMTGTIGGLGFVAFISSTIILAFKGIKKQRHNLWLWGGVYSLFSIYLHGMVDVGIINRDIFNMYILVLGIMASTYTKHLNRSK